MKFAYAILSILLISWVLSACAPQSGMGTGESYRNSPMAVDRTAAPSNQASNMAGSMMSPVTNY